MHILFPQIYDSLTLNVFSRSYILIYLLVCVKFGYFILFLVIALKLQTVSVVVTLIGVICRESITCI